ncbi:MAG: hypothetical protein Tsb0017_24820 [Geothermobacteraceae bacterium]
MPLTREKGLIPADMETLVEEYQQVRPLLVELHRAIGKLPQKAAIMACGKRLRMVARQNGKKTLVFEDEQDVEIFQDYLIYMYRPRGVSYVQQMLNRNRYPQQSAETELLKGMAKARFSVFWLKERLPSVGFVALDLLRREEVFVLDLSLPQQDVAGLVLGLRTFPWRGVLMHTGASLPLGKVPLVGKSPPLIEQPRNVQEEQRFNEEAIFHWRQMRAAREWGT